MRTYLVFFAVLATACASASNSPSDDVSGGDAGAGGESSGLGGSAGKGGKAGTAGSAGAGPSGASGSNGGAAGAGKAGTGGAAGKSGTAGAGGKAGGGGSAGKAGAGASGGGSGGDAGGAGLAGKSAGGSAGVGQGGSAAGTGGGAGTGGAAGTSGLAGTGGAAGTGGGAGKSGGAGTSGSPSCGDGTRDVGEDCDDANTKSGDGCSASCKWETSCQTKNAHHPIACGETVSGTFYGKYNDITDVCGQSLKYQDQIFVFEAKSSARVTVSYSATPDKTDIGLFVLAGSCHGSLCLAEGTTEGDRHDVSFDAISGTTYYFVLEAPSDQPQYTLKVSCP